MKTLAEDVHSILTELTGKMASSKRLVVLDVDSTLYCVSPRTEAILQRLGHELLADVGDGLPAERKLLLGRHLSVAKTTPLDWGIREALGRMPIEISRDEFFWIREYWSENFFSNQYLNRDIPYDGAIEFVNRVAGSGAEILYLTARDVERMGEGTLAGLLRSGFPLEPPKSRAHLKPHRDLSDAEFKTAALKNLQNHYDEIWFFENEPVIIEQVRLTIPKVQIVFMDSVHSGRSASPKDLPTLRMSFNSSALSTR